MMNTYCPSLIQLAKLDMNNYVYAHMGNIVAMESYAIGDIIKEFTVRDGNWIELIVERDGGSRPISVR